MSGPFNLGEIERRWSRRPPSRVLAFYAMEDVPALIAEVYRLRTQLAIALSPHAPRLHGAITVNSRDTISWGTCYDDDGGAP